MSQNDLPCTPSPQMIEDESIFFAYVQCLVPQNFFLKEKVDFVGDIRIGTHKIVVLRHNHLNPISTKLISFDNNELPIIYVSLRRRNCINNLVIYVMVM